MSFATLQNSYLNMLASEASSSSSSSTNINSATTNQDKDMNGQQEALDAIFESAHGSTHGYPSASHHNAADFSFDALFAAAAAHSHNVSLGADGSHSMPETPLLHDASQFSNLSLDLNKVSSPSSLHHAHSNANGPSSASVNAQQAFDEANAALFAQILNTPPSADDTPALSFSPDLASPFEPHTPGTGLLGLNGGEGLFDDGMGMGRAMPLFGYEETGAFGMFYDHQVQGQGATGVQEKMDIVSPGALVNATAHGLGLAVAGVQGQQQVLDVEGLGLIPMSGTPSVVPVPLSSALPTPTHTTAPSSNPSSNTTSKPPTTSTIRKPTGPTGHRKNLTPASLLPVEAPTQTRTYKGPSATSRKEIPAFAIQGGTPKGVQGVLPSEGGHGGQGGAGNAQGKKRKAASGGRKARYEEDEDEDEEEDDYEDDGEDGDEYAGPSTSSSKKRKTTTSSSAARGVSSTPSSLLPSLPSSSLLPTSSAAQAQDLSIMPLSEIEAKRRQNTLAARRSRHRKLAYVRELEESVARLTRENEELRGRVERAERQGGM